MRITWSYPSSAYRLLDYSIRLKLTKPSVNYNIIIIKLDNYDRFKFSQRLFIDIYQLYRTSGGKEIMTHDRRIFLWRLNF